MSEARIDRIANENNTGGPTLSGITTFSSQQYFIPPSGSTAQRPSDCPPGSIRFNTDSAHLEYFDGLQWLEFEASSEELGNQNAAAGSSASGTGYRGLIGGGAAPSPTFSKADIDYITISTLGDSIKFGDLFTGRYNIASCSSSTRGLWAGGQTSPGSLTNLIDFVTFSSTGNAADFADLNASNRQNCAGASSSTRGLFLGGQSPGTSPGIQNTIDYVTIASQGVNAQDFGDLTQLVQAQRAVASSTRAVRFGGATPTKVNSIDYVTISSQGNAQDFGDMSATRWFHAACSNSTRGIVFGDNPAVNSIEFITIPTTGNAQDFGDLTKTFDNCSAVSSPTRAVLTHGNNTEMEYVTLSSTGNGIVFGDLSTSHNIASGCSNGHGGL